MVVFARRGRAAKGVDTRARRKPYRAGRRSLSRDSEKRRGAALRTPLDRHSPSVESAHQTQLRLCDFGPVWSRWELFLSISGDSAFGLQRAARTENTNRNSETTMKAVNNADRHTRRRLTLRRPRRTKLEPQPQRRKAVEPQSNVSFETRNPNRNDPDSQSLTIRGPLTSPRTTEPRKTWADHRQGAGSRSQIQSSAEFKAKQGSGKFKTRDPSLTALQNS